MSRRCEAGDPLSPLFFIIVMDEVIAATLPNRGGATVWRRDWCFGIRVRFFPRGVVCEAGGFAAVTFGGRAKFGRLCSSPSSLVRELLESEACKVDIGSANVPVRLMGTVVKDKKAVQGFWSEKLESSCDCKDLQLDEQDAASSQWMASGRRIFPASLLVLLS
ncbi:unnamed protein product [Dicrocoelium dendriticum]|nr:unnamed protein product [Dicrocoelium dendriticum]